MLRRREKDVAMTRRLTLISTAVVALVVVTVLAVVRYDGRGRVARVADCVANAGYTATVAHDDGRVSAVGQDPDVAVFLADDDDMIQVRPPSDIITVTNRVGALLAIITVRSPRVTYHTDHHHPRAAEAVGSCVSQST
jgi:hypothetical protein